MDLEEGGWEATATTHDTGAKSILKKEDLLLMGPGSKSQQPSVPSENASGWDRESSMKPTLLHQELPRNELSQLQAPGGNWQASYC